MDGQRRVQRPIGWWLKEADGLLDAAFDAALAGCGTGRRGWQVPAALVPGPVSRAELAGSLAAFDPAEAVDGVVRELADRGLVEEVQGRLRLTDQGAAEQAALAARVQEVRQRVSAALPPEDYRALVGLLARLVEGLRSAS